MTPIVTVWTSTFTDNLKIGVNNAIASIPAMSGITTDIAGNGKAVAQLVVELSGAFHKMVNMTMADTALHVIAVVPLFDPEVKAQLATLCQACAGVHHTTVTLHILALGKGLQHLVDPAYDEAKAASDFQAGSNGNDLSVLDSDKYSFEFTYTVIDDYAANGAPIHFTLKSLARYIALFEQALSSSYHTILSPALIGAYKGNNITLGQSSLTFDRNGFSDRLLTLGFLSALKAAGIDDTKVDAQAASSIADKLLEGQEKRYDKLFDTSIRPLFKDLNIDEGNTAARAASILDQDIEALKNHILSILRDKTLTMPERETILGLVLGRDNERIRGVQYDQEDTLLDDVCSSCIDTYVIAFNESCSDSGLLPLRGDYPKLKIHIWDKDTETWIDSCINTQAINPIANIKELKRDILNTTAYLRVKNDELKELLDANQSRHKADEIKRQWVRPTGELKDVEYKEQPLDEKYVPPADLQLKPSVDLRKYFSPIRNQSSLGSCTSFSAAAMYEAMMNRMTSTTDNVMSPAFLFYYSNVLTGRPQGGSNFAEQLAVLGQHGICQEELYMYNAENPTVEPSVEACENAAIHKVLQAKQIPLIDESDKKTTLETNHRLITSALSEGYPVGISLEVYTNFGAEGAFILHPTDDATAQPDGYHAMVIAGYSNEGDFYIVRNSWGESFGDQGYCYIPSAYIDDPKYMNFACIITRITDTGTVGDIPSVVANFGATENEIKIAAIRNVIAKVKVYLQGDNEMYAEYYSYYQRLIQQLTIPQVQTAITEAKANSIRAELREAEEKKGAKHAEFVTKLNAYKKAMVKTIAYELLATLVLCVLYYYIGSSYIGISAIVMCILGIGTWMGYKWNVRKYRRQLQEEIDEISTKCNRLQVQLRENHIRFHVAGMWISRFYRLSIELGKVYDRLVSFNNTLEAWKTLYVKKERAEAKSDGDMFLYLDFSLAEKFFAAHEKTIVGRIDLLDAFEHYRLGEEDLENTHQQLRTRVGEVTGEFVKDFNMIEFLTGRQYDYLKPIDLEKTIGSMLAVGQPSYRNMNVRVTTPMRIVMGAVPHTHEGKWNNMISPLFPAIPITVLHDDPTSVILVTIHPV